MTKISAITALLLAASIGVSTQAYAQEKTRAEVRQELIQAEQNGSQLISNASYPDVAGIYSNQAPRQHPLQGDTTSYGGIAPTTGASGSRGAGNCVGPASFCNIYFGGGQ